MNPFIYPRVLEPHEIVGRKKDLHYVLGRLANRQSVAVIGLPNSGKTSLLLALADAGTRHQFDQERFANVLFSYANALDLHNVQTRANFWKVALRPLTEQFPAADNSQDSQRVRELLSILTAQFDDREFRELCLELGVNANELAGASMADKSLDLIQYLQRRLRLDELVMYILQERPQNQLTADKSVRGMYATAVANNFGTFVLEQLFNQLHAEGRRLALLLDDFDEFLNNTKLHTAEFYGGLRTLASRSPGFVVVIAARREVESLNQLTQAINPHGSPYFNVFTERRLGSLTKKAVNQLLERAGERFDRTDHEFVMEISGQHPYLAQVAASELWEVDEDGLENTARYREAVTQFYRHVNGWGTWVVMTPKERIVLTAVGLLQVPIILTEPPASHDHLADNLADYTTELDRLQRRGLVKRQKDDAWHITQIGFLWWLVDEKWGRVGDEASLNTWFQEEALDGVFNLGELAWIGRAAVAMRSVLPDNSQPLRAAFIKELVGKQ
ncbi:MAG: hypothetical protein GY796_07695 [Chloroflexi bacterium]|nr:hypothetical protein [Chloroflexota bacterium]